MGDYEALDKFVSRLDCPRAVRQSCQELRRVLGVTQEDLYQGIRFYYYKGMFEESASKPEVIAVTEAGGIARTTPAELSGKDCLQTQLFSLKDIQSLTLTCEANHHDSSVELCIEMQNAEIVSMKSREDSNVYWEYKFAQQIREIASFLANSRSY